jgi:hypothetical protein
MRRTALVALLLAGCAGQAIGLVQAHHGREFRCDRRYVRVERVRGDEWISRGCGFEAEWTCRSDGCELRDARAHGMSGP